ncbi:ABC transporter permease [Aciduricibacillus chroicocephali]|uniref:ABC transporter permease n=1 Tax=Aciduricibacillus chroicocephali TaxID=3054939 RepID=A0ABY9KX17_9BACI|nr:ABC transporter permease [Bacillaceae bacterium 44XB]
MNGFNVLLKKEWREYSRNYKLIWIPLVFILFGVIEPLTNRYLPEIMEKVGNLPEGAEFPWPEFTGQDVFISLMSQYQMIGLLIIILGFMGAISAERKNGTASLLYVRPLSFTSYFMSKWITINVIVLGSVWVGFGSSWYYIWALFGKVPVQDVMVFLAVYSLWIVFVTSIVLALSASFSTGVTAALGIVLTIIGSVLDSVIGQFWTITPWKLPNYAALMLTKGADRTDFWLTVVLTALLIGILVIAGILMSKRNASKATV